MTNKPLSTHIVVNNKQELQTVLSQINKSYTVEEQRARIEKIKKNMDFSHIRLNNSKNKR